MKTGKNTSTTSNNQPCTACGETKTITALQGQDHFCPHCLTTLKVMQNQRDCAIKLMQLSGLEAFIQSQQKPAEQDMPDVLDAVRYRTIDRERNTWYVSVSELGGNPVEIFASTAFDRDQHLQSRISNLTTITRLISLILRHIFLGERLTLDKTLTQLRRSSRMPDDLPAMLGKVLANYSAKKPAGPDEENVLL